MFSELRYDSLYEKTRFIKLRNLPVIGDVSMLLNLMTPSQFHTLYSVE
jgi:hypothetical protein